LPPECHLVLRRLIVGIVLGTLVAFWARGRRQPRLGREGATAGAARARGPSGLLTERVRRGTVARLLFRVLERLYSLGLGRLVGHRFPRLTHRGRKSGRRYHTVLEVISYEPASRESVVLSGWGERADWYRNIRAAPAAEVATAGHRYAPAHRLVNGPELYAHLLAYVGRNRPLGRFVRGALGLRLDGSDADRAALEACGYRGVAFRPAP
jgi:deazaflavin-dependent oxidoreductase (nitroreductase family)